MKLIGMLLVAAALAASIPAQAHTVPTTIDQRTPGLKLPSTPISLFTAGVWTHPIVLPPGASAETLAHATLLQSYLQRMGPAIPVVHSSTAVGIKVGTYTEWQPHPAGFNDVLLNNAHDYAIVSRAGGLLIGGKDQESLEMGVWRFLELLGYRQFFPTATWEVVPALAASLTVHLRLGETRLFDSEQMLASSWDLAEINELVTSWKRKNRIEFAGGVDDHQMWMFFIQENSDAFTKNPHYASTAGWKLCVMEPELQALFIDYMRKQVLTKPEKRTFSVTATDGSLGWSEPCPNGYAVKDGGTGENSMTPSDRQVFLANLVQKAFRQEAKTNPIFAGKRVAMLAYGDTSLRPNLRVDEDVIITVTTAFIKGGQTVQQVAENYRAMGSPKQVIGYYSYLGTQLWGHGNPTSSKITNQGSWVPLFEEVFAVTTPSPMKYIKGESGNAWGAYGLGFYVFSKLLAPPTTPNSDASVLIPHIKADFLTRAFGPAAGPVGSFLDLITAADGAKKLLSTDLLHRMYDFLSQARGLINPADGAIKARIDDLILYTRSQDLWRLALVANAQTSEKFDAFNTLSQFAYRIRNTMMFDFYNLFYDPQFASLEQGMMDLYGLKEWTPSAVIKNSGWSTAPFTEPEIVAILAQGLVNNPLLPFEPISYSMEDLDITAAFDNDPRGRAGPDQDDFLLVSKDHDWILKTKPGQTTFTISAKAGSGSDHTVDPNGPATIELYQTDLTSGLEFFVGSFSVVADNFTVATHTFDVAPYTTYRMRVIDPRVMVHLKWDKTLNKIVNVPLEGDYHLKLNTSYFYVPKSATSIGVYLGRDASKIYTPDNKLAYEHKDPDKGAFLSIPIANAADKGKIWKIYCRASDNPLHGCYLLNVPPQLSRSPQEMLLQKSLIIKDGL